MATTEVTLYQIKSAIYNRGLSVTAFNAIPAAVDDPIYLQWWFGEEIVLGDALSDVLQTAFVYDDTQMQSLFDDAGIISTALATGTSTVSLYHFKRVVAINGLATTAFNSVEANVGDAVHIEWWHADTITIGDSLSETLRVAFGFTPLQMQALFDDAAESSIISSNTTIIDYSSLVTAVADWMARTDLTDKIPTFIVMFENWFSRNVQLSRMLVSDTLTTSATGSVAVPAGVSRLTGVTTSTGGRSYSLHPSNPVYAANIQPGAGVPRFYYLQNNTIQLHPASAATINVQYYEKLPHLSPPNGSNWLLTESPEAYLYGTLVQVAIYIDDPALLQSWGAVLSGIIDSLQSADDGKWTGGQMRIMGATP